jgi:hypothetical protein
MADVTIREIEPEDESAIGSLLSQVADGGRVAFAPRYRVPVLHSRRGTTATPSCSQSRQSRLRRSRNSPPREARPHRQPSRSHAQGL